MNAPLTVVIANKNYSSWSMRPWVLLRGRDIAFRERMLKFESQEWRDQIARLSPSGLVPVLWEGEPGAGFATWDTLAIAERLHELLPDRGIWPADSQLRARARSAAAEMHSGFRALRGAMPMNIRSCYPGKGMNDGVAKDIARIGAIWAAAKRPYLFGEFCAADAFYAPWRARAARRVRGRAEGHGSGVPAGAARFARRQGLERGCDEGDRVRRRRRALRGSTALTRNAA